MLGYLVRTLPVALRAQLGARGALVGHLRRRVGPHEIDLNLHMNQAVYAQVAELARVDWILRSGAWDRWRADGLKPVVAEQRIVYRRELKPGAAYAIDTRAVAMDGRLLVFESYLLVGDRVHARVDVRLIFIGPDGVLDAATAGRACAGLTTEPLAIVDWRVVAQRAS